VTLDVDFVFTDEERDGLEDTFKSITASPYRLYGAVMAQADALIHSNKLPERFIDWTASLVRRDRHSRKPSSSRTSPRRRSAVRPVQSKDANSAASTLNCRVTNPTASSGSSAPPRGNQPCWAQNFHTSANTSPERLRVF